MNTILPTDLRIRLNSGEALILLDVRENQELMGELGHIPNIVHIPLGELPVRLGELTGHKESPVVTICKMGGRAERAGEFLEHAGFKNVILLEGGMMSWKESGLPVETARK